MPNPFSAIASLVRSPGFRKGAPLVGAAGAGAAGAEALEEKIDLEKDRLRAQGAMAAVDAMQEAEHQMQSSEALMQQAYQAGAEDMMGYGGGGMESLAAAEVAPGFSAKKKSTALKPNAPGIKVAAVRSALHEIPTAFMDSADLWKYAGDDWASRAFAPEPQLPTVTKRASYNLKKLAGRLDSENEGIELF